VYFLLGISLTLAFLLIVNVAAAIIATGLWKLIERPVTSLSVKTRARIIFALRIGPVAAALIVVSAFIVPAYLLHEPENSGEAVSGKLAIIAFASSAAVCFSFFRICKTWFVTRRLASNWRKNASEISLPDIDVRVLRIVHAFPVMAVIGIIRPQIFVAERVLATLSTDELQAAMAHEYGHLRAHDNLKRSILRVCRDLLIIPVGARLDRAWADSAESAADEYAAKKGRSTALNLASALIKVARIAPKCSLSTSAIGSYLIDQGCGDVTARVRRLLNLSEELESSEEPAFRVYSERFWLLLPTAVTAFLVLHLTDRRLLLSTHEAIEHFVWMIQ
jgi:Zn-dependent protease with chaperone function